MTSHMPGSVYQELMEAERQARFWNANGEYIWASQWQKYADGIRQGYQWYARQLKSVEYKRRNGENYTAPSLPNIPTKRPTNNSRDQLISPGKVKNPMYQGVSVSGGSCGSSRNTLNSKPVADTDREVLAQIARHRAKQESKKGL